MRVRTIRFLSLASVVDPSERGQVYHVILSEPLGPSWKRTADGVDDPGPDVELDPVPLPVVEADRFHA